MSYYSVINNNTHYMVKYFIFLFKMFNKDIVIKCGFQTIHSNYTLTNNKGKKLAESGHVNLVTEVKSTNMFSIITASVIRQTSVSCEPWKV